MSASKSQVRVLHRNFRRSLAHLPTDGIQPVVNDDLVVRDGHVVLVILHIRTSADVLVLLRSVSMQRPCLLFPL